MVRASRPPILGVLALGIALLGACRDTSGSSEQATAPSIRSTRSTPALRLVSDPARWQAPMRTAFEARDERLSNAITHSLAWLNLQKSHAHFPSQESTVSHRRALESLVMLERLLKESPNAGEFIEQVSRNFDVYEAVGENGNGQVLFTAYYAPGYPASRERTQRFRFPIYSSPDGVDEREPAPAWHTRRQIEDESLLVGRELAWLENALDAYLVHINGSARLSLPDGTFMVVGHTGTNGRGYTSLGRLMIDTGLAAEAEMSMQVIREVHTREPTAVEALMLKNDRYVFFREFVGEPWPCSSLGIPLTQAASLATDKSAFPPGALALVDTQLSEATGHSRRFARFLLDQDSGGAIRGPGRADIYLGAGEEVGRSAGLQQARGHLFYLFLSGRHDD